MGKEYNNKLTSFLLSLQKDLKDRKIDEEQFNFLLGVFFKNEMNQFIKDELDELIPQEESDKQKMTLLSYKKNSKLTYA